jgi:hypothetical protein
MYEQVRSAMSDSAASSVGVTAVCSRMRLVFLRGLSRVEAQQSAKSLVSADAADGSGSFGRCTACTETSAWLANGCRVGIVWSHAAVELLYEATCANLSAQIVCFPTRRQRRSFVWRRHSSSELEKISAAYGEARFSHSDASLT